MYTVEKHQHHDIWWIRKVKRIAECYAESDAHRIAAALNLVEGGAVDKAREFLDQLCVVYEGKTLGDKAREIREALAALGGEVAR